MSESLALVVVITFCLLLLGPKHATLAHAQLRFRKDGQFKILQVSDMHYANGKNTPCLDVLPSQVEGCSDLNTTAYLQRYIQLEKPDLIIFSGDNIHGKEVIDARKSMDEAFAHAIESNIPWAAILGNHDSNFQTVLTRQQVMEYIVGMKNTVSLLNPINNLNEDEPIYGWGNYNLEVAGVQGSAFEQKSVLNLYLLDSGDYNKKTMNIGYDWIHPSQQAWFTRTSKALKKAYMREPNPQEGAATGIVFFHIPIPEFKNISSSEMVGIRQEKVQCPMVNSGFFDTMVAAEDAKAIFVGHGHLNDYCGNLCGLSLCNAAGFGYHGYGKAGWPRRARIINIKLDKTKDDRWGPVKSIETWKRIHDEHLTLIDRQVLWTSYGDRVSSKSNLVASE